MSSVKAIVLYKHREVQGFRGRCYYQWKMLKTKVHRNVLSGSYRVLELNACHIRVYANFGFHFNDPNPLAREIFGNMEINGDCALVFLSW